MRKEQLTQFNRGQASKIFKDVAKTRTPLIVMQHSNALVVIVSVDEYCSLKNINSLKLDIFTQERKENEKRER